MLRTHKKNLDTPMTYYKARVSQTKLPSCNENKLPQTPPTSNPHYLKKNVDRRDKRKDKRLDEVQNKLSTANRTIESLHLEVSEATASLTQTASCLEATKQQLEAEQRVSSHLKGEHEELQEMVARLIEENQSLQENITQLEEELDQVDGMTYNEKQDGQELEHFVITTTNGKRYSNGVRELYYKLLTMQITPAKIAKIIKAVLKSMIPSVNVESLKLPKRAAALYMRSQELPTVNDIHKATVLSDASQKHLNTDGTTLHQQKLNSIAVNDLCLSVGKVPYGTADSVVEHIDRELNRLRELAHKLKLNGANNINWNSIASSGSEEHQPRNASTNCLRSVECKTERDLESSQEKTLQLTLCRISVACTWG